jgi:glycosyltransferase involved in cell wall biosynthesis
VARTLNCAEVTAALRGFRRIGSEPFEILCPAVDTVAFRDVIELYLTLTGASHVRWRDADGRIAEKQPLARIAANLLADIWALPVQLLRQRRGARMVVKQAGARLIPSRAPQRALYLRSDHWFGTQSGGSVGHVRGVIAGLRRRGIVTDVVATDRLAGVPDDAQFHLCRPAYGIGRNLPCVPELAYNDRMTAFADSRWAAWRPDFIYQRLSLCNFTGAALRGLHGVPYICEYNGSLAWMARHWDKRPLLFERTALAIEQAALAAADLVVVVSDASRKELLARGLPSDRILVNPNGVDPEIYHPAVDGGAVRERAGIGDEIVLGFIGTFGKWHGAEKLAHAFARLLSDRPDLRPRIRLLMIGDGLMKPAAEQALREGGAADRAIFTGLVPQEQGPAHLAACDILVSPHVRNPDGSPFFGSPTKLFEYMAMGRPILASDLDQIGEVLRHGETAWMAPPGDADALAQGLAVLIEDPALRARLGAAARREAVATYSWTAHVQRILTALGGAA